MKTVLITGATKGIGKAIAERFNEQGYKLLLLARNLNDLELQKKDLERTSPGGQIDIFKTDITDKNSVEELIKFIDKSGYKVDILINNAGIFEQSSILDEKEDVFFRALDTHAVAVYRLSKYFGNKMKACGSGHIFNIGSIAGNKAFVNCGSYCVSKAALNMLTKVLREELKTYGVKVTLVTPGATLTSSWKGTDLPTNRFISPIDIAEMIFSCSLLSNQSVVEEINIQPLLGEINN